MTYHSGRAAAWAVHGNRQRSNQLFPRLELTPDFNRGELRLTAEVALCVLTCRDVPTYAHERAVQTLNVLANQ